MEPPPAELVRPAGRRCRRTPQPRREGELRPTDIAGAFFLCGAAFLAAAALAGVVEAVRPWPWGRWLALHLAFVGGVSQLVLGASQFFAGAFLATDPPPRRLVRAQVAAWNTGAVALAVAVPAALDVAIWPAVALLLAALGLWSTAVAAMWRRSLRRSRWAVAWYCSATLFLGLGMTAGSLLAHGDPWPHGNLLGAHMALNLGGWFGASIVGTLHTFFPSLTQSRLRFPRLQGAAYLTWIAGVAALAAGSAWSLDPLALGGWLALCCGAVALLVNVGGCLREAARPLSLPARLVALAQPFLLAALALATVAAFEHGPAEALGGSTRAALGTLLVAGWIGLTVIGSLLHLLAVVIRVRGGFAARMPVPRPLADSALTIAAGLAIAAVALTQGGGAQGWHGTAKLLLVAAYAALGARVSVLVVGVLTRARPSL